MKTYDKWMLETYSVYTGDLQILQINDTVLKCIFDTAGDDTVG
jgi:hypothetical protein